jgi:hypothetical protein
MTGCADARVPGKFNPSSGLLADHTELPLTFIVFFKLTRLWEKIQGLSL